MSLASPSNVGILGLGVAYPDKVLSNADLERMVDTNDEWITARTGIKERRILDEGQAPLDIALPAAQRAIADAGIAATDIDAIIYSSFTPDFVMPPSACLIQAAIKAKPVLAYDMNAACSGFVFGLHNAYSLVKSGYAKHVLLLGVDCNSRVVDYTDRSTCILFGDAAGAVVVGEVEAPRGILGNDAGTDGSGAFLITQKIGGGAHPWRKHAQVGTDHYMQMNGREVFKFAVRVFPQTLEAALKGTGLTVKEIDLLVPHQANIRIIESAMEKFGYTTEQVVINIQQFGNTSAASIPLALETARQDGRLKQGTTCGLVAFGAGLTYGATVLRW